MHYIILDMEWNQPWPGSYAAKKVLESPIRGEIIQIGAVRVSERRKVLDEFQILIRPKHYKKLNKKISTLTGLKDADLKEKGVPFPDAVEAFRRWCGEDIIFLTWGFDDIRILKENLVLFHLPTEWCNRWYNAQMIFNAQTDGATAQKALKTAMEIMGIEPSRPAHDALGDAYHTALICSRLDLKKGVENYKKALESHENGFHGAELPDCLERRVFKEFKDKAEAIAAMETTENFCPKCKRQMQPQRWITQPGHRCMTKMSCPKCGGFLVRLRLQHDEDGTLRVSRLVYTGGSEAAKSYERQLALKTSNRRRPKRGTKKTKTPTE